MLKNYCGKRNVGKSIEQAELSHTAGGDIKWHGHIVSPHGSICLIWACDPRIPSLGVYPREKHLYFYQNTHAMFIAALFIIAYPNVHQK